MKWIVNKNRDHQHIFTGIYLPFNYIHIAVWIKIVGRDTKYEWHTKGKRKWILSLTFCLCTTQYRKELPCSALLIPKTMSLYWNPLEPPEAYCDQQHSHFGQAVPARHYCIVTWDLSASCHLVQISTDKEIAFNFQIKVWVWVVANNPAGLRISYWNEFRHLYARGKLLVLQEQQRQNRFEWMYSRLLCCPSLGPHLMNIN